MNSHKLGKALLCIVLCTADRSVIDFRGGSNVHAGRGGLVLPVCNLVVFSTFFFANRCFFEFVCCVFWHVILT